MTIVKKKTLLVLASTYPRWVDDHEPGFVHELSKRLTDNFNVMVVCPHSAGSKEYEKMDGVDVYRYRYAPSKFESLVNNGGIVSNLKSSKWKLLLLPLFFIAQLLVVKSLIKKHDIDIIHAHWLIPQGFTLALLSTLIKIPPFVVTSHGADLFALKGLLFNRLKLFVSEKSTRLTVVSRVMKNSLINSGVPKDKIVISPMGVDMSRFITSKAVKRSKKELLFVGRLVEKKGLYNLILALPRILKIHPDTYLTVVGFGPEKIKLQTLIKDLCLNDYVNFVGAVPQKNLVAYYQKAAVFVAPFIEDNTGDQEGLGLVLVEAIACGCPVVVSDIPACNDVIDSMKGIHRFKSESIDALTDAINKALNTDQLTTQATTENIEKLKQKFSWTRVAIKYNLQLQGIITEKPRT